MLTSNQAVLLIAACVTILAVGYGVSHALHRPAVQSFNKGNAAGCLFWEVLAIAVFVLAMFAYFRFVGSYP